MEGIGEVSVIIRTLNERDRLLALMNALDRQTYIGKYEIVIVDNESTDGTQELFQSFSSRMNAKLVTIPRDSFSFPVSLNIGAQAASGDILVYLVGHALPFEGNWLVNGLEHFRDRKVAGVYSPVIPHENCTFAESAFYWPGYLAAKKKGPHNVTKGGMGIFGGTNMALRRALWEAHPFDERYGLGGEDGEWASWAMKRGYKIVCDYRFAVRHSHGLGLIGLAKQLGYWRRLGKPSTFDRGALRFRKDLNFKA